MSKLGQHKGGGGNASRGDMCGLPTPSLTGEISVPWVPREEEGREGGGVLKLLGLCGADGHPNHVLVGLGDEELASVPPNCDPRRAQQRRGAELCGEGGVSASWSFLTVCHVDHTVGWLDGERGRLVELGGLHVAVAVARASPAAEPATTVTSAPRSSVLRS